ncbi:TonB-dependent receptor domain-containing protein [Cephaloticoccus capnophilus]|uniref:TonB-dependent receptor domain-containing protein n=1 Tax=Cephaloticoccus capnophilus TaxID=1548208 RepID=UPI0018D307AA|nr:TonB-dependent receptor [Cephaloticoccus capnophilus]
MLTLAAFEVSSDRIERTAYEGNMDLLRSEYDVQPYSIIGREVITRSGATTVEDLLRQQLTMNTAFSSSAQSATGYGGSASSFSLRGLSAAETLVLINGRRVAGVGRSSSTEAGDQPDLNGIPLAAIERIEVLPASASAIYGSSAVGGVINVVLRREYSGHELNTRFEMTDDWHAPIETFNWTSSFQFEGGRTQLLISAQYQDTRALYGHQRDFQRKGRAQILENDPDAFYVPAGTRASPPWGALVNIRSRDGSPLFGPGSSHFTHIPKGYRGWQIDGLQPLIDNQGTYNLDLARGMASGFTADAEIMAASRSKSLSLNGSREMTEKLKVFFDGGYSHSEQNPYDSWYGAWTVRLFADSPNNPFGQDVQVTYPVRNVDRRSSSEVNTTIRGERVAVGFEYELPRRWRVVGNYSWSHSVNHHQYLTRYGSPTREDAIHDGVLDVLRDTSSFPTLIDEYAGMLHRITNAWSSDSTLRAAGGLGDWWYAGEIILANGIERRELRQFGIGGNSDDLHPPPVHRRQQVDSFYTEATVPLVASHQRRRWLHSAELQLAARHERFNVETAGSKYDTTVPTFGIRYLPVRELIFRTSYGRGFRAPTYAQLTEPTLSTSTSTVNDPKRGGEAVDIFTLRGGNTAITPETSRNLNIGLVWSPERIPGLRFSADWYRIEKRNNITTPGTQALLDEEDEYPGRVIRGPVDPSDPYYPVGPVIQINRAVMNMLKMETSGIDLGARYLWRGGSFGDVDIAANATLSDYYRTQTSITSGVLERRGIPSQSGPLNQRINGSLVWTRGPWSCGWATQYYSRYRITPTSTTSIRRQGGPLVASQIYHDVFVRYRVSTRGRHRAFEGLELTLGAKNVLDKAPPTDMSRGYYYSTFGDPRMRRLYANVKKTF